MLEGNSNKKQTPYETFLASMDLYLNRGRPKFISSWVWSKLSWKAVEAKGIVDSMRRRSDIRNKSMKDLISIFLTQLNNTIDYQGDLMTQLATLVLKEGGLDPASGKKISTEDEARREVATLVSQLAQLIWKSHRGKYYFFKPQLKIVNEPSSFSPLDARLARRRRYSIDLSEVPGRGEDISKAEQPQPPLLSWRNLRNWPHLIRGLFWTNRPPPLKLEEVKTSPTLVSKPKLDEKTEKSQEQQQQPKEPLEQPSTHS